MIVKHPRRFLVVALASVGLSFVLLIQAMSVIATRQSPEVAVRLMPKNGLALERFAFATLGANVGDAIDPIIVNQAAAKAAPIARDALELEPLLPKAHAIVALAEQDAVARTKLLVAASALNRREIALQGAILQSQIEIGDYDGVFSTVDKILRVNPEVSDQFFPILLTALQEERGALLIARLVAGQSPWIQKFLLFAVKRDEVLSELADLREQIDIGDERFDQQLVSQLAARSEFGRAWKLYRLIQRQAGYSKTIGGAVDWRTEYPPFDWRLASTSGFRAQIQRDGRGVDIFARLGKSGNLLDRLFLVPTQEFRIDINHSLSPVNQLKHVRLQLRCGTDRQPFYNKALAARRASFEIQQRPANCTYVRLTLHTRVSVLGRNLEGTIDSLRISPLN